MARRVAALMLLGSFGCGAKREAEPTVPLAEVPATALAAAAKELPGVHFETAWKAEGAGQGGEVAYEIRGRDETGKTRELRVTASGKVLEVE